MQSNHTLDTGHDLVLSLAGNEWDGFCFNCVVEFIEQKVSRNEADFQEPIQLLLKCAEEMDGHYNMERVVQYVYQSIFDLVLRAPADSAGNTVEILWTTFCPVVAIKHVPTHDIMLQLSTDNDGKKSAWLQFYQLKILRHNLSQAALHSFVWEHVLMKVMSQGKRINSIGSRVADVAEVALKMEAVHCVTLLQDRVQASPKPEPDSSSLMTALLAELSFDYSALLSAHSNLSVLANLSPIGYQCGILSCTSGLLQRASESTGTEAGAAASQRLMDCFVAQHQPRHVLPLLVHRAVVLHGLGCGLEGLRCIQALLRLAAALGANSAAHVAGRLLAEDCNCGSKLFGVLEQTPPGSGDGPSTVPFAAVEQLCSASLLLLARCCPARYFHYSLFTHSVRTSLFHRYLGCLHRLIADRVGQSLLPVLGAQMDERCTPSSSASLLQSLLVCAAQHGAIPRGEAGAMVVHLVLELKNYDTPRSEAAALGLAASVLSLVEALLLQPRSDQTHRDAPMPSSAPASECAVLAWPLLAGIVRASPPLRHLQGCLRTELLAALLACLRLSCACSAAEQTGWCADENFVCVVYFSSAQLSHQDVSGSSNLDRDALFAALVEVLALPTVRSLHCSAWRGRLLHASLAGYFVKRALATRPSGGGQLHQENRLADAYARFLLCTSSGQGSEDRDNQRVSAVRAALTAVTRALRAQPHGGGEDHVWTCSDREHAARLVASLSKSGGEGRGEHEEGDTVLFLCFYLQACLDHCSSSDFALADMQVPSVDCVTAAARPRAPLAPAVAAEAHGGWVAQGLAMYRNPLSLCRLQPHTVHWLLLQLQCGDELMEDYLEVSLTYTLLMRMLVLMRPKNSDSQLLWVLLLRCRHEDLSLYWQSCALAPALTVSDPSADPNPSPTLTLSEEVYAMLVRQAVAAGEEEEEALRAVLELGLSVDVSSAAGLAALVEALVDAVTGATGRPVYPPAWTLVLQTLARLLDASLLLCDTDAEGIYERAGQVLQRAREEATAFTTAMVQSCGVKLYTAAFRRRFGAYVLAALEKGEEDTSSAGGGAVSSETVRMTRMATEKAHLEAFQLINSSRMLDQALTMEEGELGRMQTLLFYLFSAAAGWETAGPPVVPAEAWLAHSLQQQLLANEESPVHSVLRGMYSISCLPPGRDMDKDMDMGRDRVGRSELMPVLHCALCCLAGVLLRLSPSACAGVGVGVDAGAGAGAVGITDSSPSSSIPIPVLLRCWLLRAQELMLACDTALSLAADGPPPLLAPSLHALHRCAALYCRTCQALDFSEGKPRQAWCDLWGEHLGIESRWAPAPPAQLLLQQEEEQVEGRVRLCHTIAFSRSQAVLQVVELAHAVYNTFVQQR